MGAHLGISVFDYIERAGAKSPVFYNTVYCPELQQAVLRPFSHLSDLVLWDYYTGEEMRHGPPYDPEYADLDLASDEEVKSMVGDLSGYGPAKSTLTQGDYSVDLDHLQYKYGEHWTDSSKGGRQSVVFIFNQNNTMVPKIG